MASVFLLTGVATAEQDTQSYYIDANDSLSLSLRFGLNMSGKFTSAGRGSPAYANGARTPNGAPYNFDNGYVLTDVSGNAHGQTYYYGYESPGQVGGVAGAQTLALTRTSSAGPNDALYDPRVGAELTYNHQLGVKENWHHLRYGVEVAANYTYLMFQDTVAGNVTQYLYNFAPGTTAPTAPFQGNFNGPGANNNSYAILDATPFAQNQQSSFIEQQQFRGNLWGFRIGPYVELPVNKDFTLHLSGGFAVGLLNANASWSEISTPGNGGGATSASGGGSDLSALYGGYVRLDAVWQLDRHWAVEAGAQFQDLGTYSHDFGGRTVELDLSKSVFVEAGLSYSF
jgi:hypothetical protein